jgi:hypothetical protein
MKRLLLLLSVFFFAINGLQAQVPQGIPYQAAARGANGQPLVNTNVKVRFSIIDSVATGTTVYQETHTATTNTVGLFSVNVGLGTPVSGTFAGINWGKNFKFMKVELDPSGTGSNYTDLGTQQMMSVPYALYAGNGGNLSNGNGFMSFSGLSINGPLSSLGITPISGQGVGCWGGCCVGCTFVVPAGKVWKITSYTGNPVHGINTNSESWLDEGQSLSFDGTPGSQIPFSFFGFQFDKSQFPAEIVSGQGIGCWGGCCVGCTFMVPQGKIWKIISHSGNVVHGLSLNGDSWLNEGQYLQFDGTPSSQIPFSFVALQFTK